MEATGSTKGAMSVFAHFVRRHRRALLALLVFAGLATALLNRALLPNYTLLPLDLIQSIAPWDHLDLGPLANPLISDPLYIFFPNRYFQATAIQNGQIPLWNPTILSGSPIIADPNFQPFYPPNLITAIFLPVQHALPWLAWGHLILTGGLMYGFLRQRKLVWLASVLGSGIWMLNSYLLVWLENPHRLSTLAWLPGIFWAYQKAVDDRRLDYAALGGLLLGLAILGGQVQFVLISGLVLGVYTVSMMVWNGFKRNQWSLRPLIPLFIVGAIGLGIGAIILLPSGEFAAYSQRIRYTAETVTRTRFPAQNLITAIAPDFYGNPVNPEGYWGQLPNYAELAIYFGVVAFLLAVTAPFVARWRQFAFTAVVVTLFILAVALGTPLVNVLFLFPGAQFIGLGRLLFALPFIGAWLAAIGLDGWLAAPKQRRWILIPVWLLIIGGAFVTLWAQRVTPQDHLATYIDLARSGVYLLLATALILVLPRNRRLFGGILVLLAFVDLLTAVWDFNPITSTAYLYPENEVVDYLHEDNSLYRVLPLQSERLIFGPNVMSVFGVQEIGGYSSLIQGDYHAFYKEISDQVEFSWLDSSLNKLAMSVFDPMVSLLNVKYVLSAKPLPTDEIVHADQMGCDATVFLDEDWATQSFTATKPGLNRIDIWQAPRASGDSSTIQFRLWRDTIDGDLVAEAEIPVSQTDAPEPLTTYFAPVADSAGQTFVWGVTGDQEAAVCAIGPDQDLAFTAYGTQLILRAERDGIWIYENPNTLPRAYLVHHAETVPANQLLERVSDTDFDFYHSVLLTSPLTDEQNGQLAESPIRSQGEATIVEYDLHKVDLNVTADRPGILVLADAHYPGWKVTVNGAEQKLHEVNSVFRGVFLPAGSHAVSFQFRPATLYWGLGIAALSVTLAMVIILGAFLGRRKSAAVVREVLPDQSDQSPAPESERLNS